MARRLSLSVLCLLGSWQSAAQHVEERQLDSSEKLYDFSRDRRSGTIVVWQNDPIWVSHVNSSIAGGVAEELAQDAAKPPTITRGSPVRTNLIDNAQVKPELKRFLDQKGLYAVETPFSRDYVIVRYTRAMDEEELLCKEIMDADLAWFAVPDYSFASQEEPNDPYYQSYQWHHAKTESPAAWDYTTGDPSILVAVCDSGFEVGHPDLAGNLQLPGYNAVDDSSDVGPYLSGVLYPHGTRVAGVLGAVGNNGLGVSGTEWSTRILPIKIAYGLVDGSSRAYYTDMRKGVEYAADRGAKVVNLSFGGCHRTELNLAGEYLRARGGLLFMSAGNNDHNWGTGSDFPSFVTVGATDQNDARANFPPQGKASNWGDLVDVVAPGLDICTLDTNNAVRIGSWGTSYASPIVAGIAALLWSYDPSLTPLDVESIIFTSCVDIGAPGNDSVFGHGRVDAGKALSILIDWWSTPCVGDFDNDGKDDLAMYREKYGFWRFLNSSGGNTTDQFGYDGAVPVVGDFDGDGKDDYAVYDDNGIPGHASPGSWFFMQSLAGYDDDVYGYGNTTPLVGDFDGDGEDDYGVWDPITAVWSVMRSQAGFWSIQFGFGGTKPVVGDFDGDGSADYGVYDPATATWYLMMTSAGFDTVYAPTGKHPLAP